MKSSTYSNLIDENKRLQMRLSQTESKLLLMEARIRELESSHYKENGNNKPTDCNYLNENLNSANLLNLDSYVQRLEEKLVFYKRENEKNLEKLSKRNIEYDKLYQNYVRVMRENKE